MAIITRLSRLLNGVQRQVDLTQNSLQVNTLQLTDDAGVSASELTRAILDALILIQTQADADGTFDSRYFTQSELGATTEGSSGASLIGIPAIRSANNVEDAAQALDAALTTAESNISTNSSNISINGTAISNLQSLSGEPAGAMAHADFTGSIIPSGATTRTALQSLETAVELRALIADVLLRDGSQGFTGNQNANSFTIQNLAEPVNANDAARLIDVQTAAAGILAQPSVFAATTVNIADLAAGAPSVVDGQTVSTGQRILVPNQTDASENGIYVVDSAGTGSNGQWLRAPDFDGTPANEVQTGALVFVEQGSTFANTSFYLTSAVSGPLNVGTDSLDWIIFSRAENIQAGFGISKMGLVVSVDSAQLAGQGIVNNAGQLDINLAANSGLSLASSLLSVVVDNSTLEIVGGALQIADAGVGTAQIADDAVTAAKVNADVAGNGLNQAASGALEVDFGTMANQAVDAGELASTSAGQGASRVGVQDLANNFAASDVEAVLAELQQNINNISTDALLEEINAGEALGTGLRAVRFPRAADSATLGTVILADNDASSVDNFHVSGVVLASGQLAGDSASVIKQGRLNAAGHGFTVGEPIFLGSSGALVQVAPSAADTASVIIGVARDANTIDVRIQIMGVN